MIIAAQQTAKLIFNDELRVTTYFIIFFMFSTSSWIKQYFPYSSFLNFLNNFILRKFSLIFFTFQKQNSGAINKGKNKEGNLFQVSFLIFSFIYCTTANLSIFFDGLIFKESYFFSSILLLKSA